MSNTALAIADNQLASAKEQLPVGTFIQHTKTERTYEVTGHSIREEDLAILFHYTEADLKTVTDPSFAFLRAFGARKHKSEWSRPFTQLFEETTIPGHLWDGLITTRFIIVEPKMIWAPVQGA